MRTGLGIRSPLSWTARSRNDVPALLPRPSPPLNLARGFRAPNPVSATARALRALMARRPGRGDGRDEEEMESSRGQLVRTLLIDNYDSYTYNIYQELSVVNGVPPVVVHNDEWTWDYICHCLYEERAFDNIVISPGPGTPTCPKDVGICLQILLECKDLPILGVCLGHQALGLVHGAQIVHAPEPVHGRLSEIEHSGCNLFSDIPSGRNSGFKVVRYHSLVIDAGSLPKELIPIAWTASLHTQSLFEIRESDLMLGAFGNGTNQLHSIDPFADNLKSTGLVGPSSFSDLESTKILMGIMHCSRPHYGVQFHPESVATCHGRQIFKNFKKMTVDYGLRSSQFHARKVSHACLSSKGLPKRKLFDNKAARHQLVICGNQKLPQKNMDGMHMRLQWKRIDGLLSQIGGAANIFCELFGDKNAKDTFWLDSSSTDQGKARFSFLGGKGGPLWKQITFELSDQSKLTAIGGRVSIEDVHGSVKTTFIREGFLEFLNKELQSFHYDEEDYEELPFDFCGGFIGFIGYNLKVECGASSNCHKSTTPDACFFFADNLVVIDHSNGDVYILSIKEISHADTKGAVQESLEEKSWLVQTEKRLLSLKATARKKLNKWKPHAGSPIPCKASFVIEKPRHQYIRDVEKCLKFIRDGESYELCLTTQMRKRADGINPLDIYLNLRDQNPAPYAAWLNFDRENLSICCSSPERFLRLDGSGILEAKPIKGTIARGRTSEEDEHLRLQLQYSEKDQAENLMIVDLLRNDLGRVCEPGSVHVPRLMEVESYATVHTMVSTIQGKRRPNVSPIDCVRAAFPGGSMTGAPKLRSVELLDSLESSSRGIYSGCIGFFSYNQTFDLNIVIRTVVIHKGEASVGAGGAIVALSNPEVEYEEMLLKAKAPTKVVEECSREFNHRSMTFKMATQ